jgi:hypothetical protein
VVVIMEAPDSGVLDPRIKSEDAVHPFGLVICPWVLDFGQPALNAVLFAAHAELGRDKGCGRPARTAWLDSELDAIVGQDSGDLVRNGLCQ